MRKIWLQTGLGIVCAGILGVAGEARAIVINGTLDPAFGPALATQTINTNAGDATGGDDSAGGSELDAAYGLISGGNLYLFFAGNLGQDTDLSVFISAGDPGQSTFSVPQPQGPPYGLPDFSGSAFSPGFEATYAFDVSHNSFPGLNNDHGVLYNTEYVYGGPGSLTGGFVGDVFESPEGIAADASSGGYATIGINNSNASTMGPAGTPANPAGADAVSTGFEMEVPLSVVGYAGGNIDALACLSYDGTSLYNQFLPGIPSGAQTTVGMPGVLPNFNFTNSPGEFFVISPIPEPASAGLFALGLFLLSRRGRRSN
jgi:hypothetical protein